MAAVQRLYWRQCRGGIGGSAEVVVATLNTLVSQCMCVFVWSVHL